MEITLKGDAQIKSIPSLKDKALRINLNENIYGTLLKLELDKKLLGIFLEQEVHLEQLLKQCLPMINHLVMQFMVLKVIDDMLLRIDYEKC